MSGLALNLPQYIKNGDFASQEPFFELLVLILTQWFNSNGFYLPTLTNAQAASLYIAGQTPAIWYNSDADKLQFAGATAIQTITSA